MEDDRLPNPDGAETPETTRDAAEAPAPSAEAGAADAAQSDAPPARRGLKLVVTLRPDDGAAYRAVLALGADGCDPLLRAADVDDLQAALDEVPGLLAEAQARWAEQPRNPAVRPARTARAAASRAPAASDQPTATKPPAATPAQPTGPGQLTLFG